MSQPHAYRADIDGMRALAVLAVLLFHLEVPGFAGGFVGVDVFFVISGYLITGLVLNDLEQNRFSLSNFYLRRIRRLVPALFVMLVPVTIAAFFVLRPHALMAFSTSLAVQFLALQNFYFLIVGDYFESALSKPLLHTWTLGVEEQFYLFWPLVLLFLGRFSSRTRICLVAALLLASFGLNLALMSVSPKASFFLLPPRAWELGIGGLIALLCQGGTFGRLTNRQAIGLSVVGLLGVVVPVLEFEETTPFPGWAATLPVLGAVLLIVAGLRGDNPISRWLSARPLVHVGKLSYPMYLWHWPLISFASMEGLEIGSPVLTLALGIATWGLSELTVRLVEEPVRRKRWLTSNRSLVVAAAVVGILVSSAGLYGRVSDGAVYRFPAAARPYLLADSTAQSDRCGFVFRVLNPRAPVCALVESDSPRRKVLLWGNSHADMWSGMLRKSASTSQSALYLNARNCRSVTDSAFCDEVVQRDVLDFVERQGLTDVVLASTWYGAYDRDDALFEAELRDVVARLASLDVKVWLVIDPPSDASFSPLIAYEANPASPAPAAIPYAGYEATYQRQRALFQLLIETHGSDRVQVLDASQPFCDKERCMAGSDDGPWYRDPNHLTDHGAMVAASVFEPVFAPEVAAQ